MPESKLRITKRQIQAIAGLLVVVLVLGVLIFSYPWLQLQVASHMIQAGKYESAEQILLRLTDSRQDWNEPRSKLVLAQLHQGKGREAAATVISMTDLTEINDLDLAIILSDVAQHLVNTGHGENALKLAEQVLAQRNDSMLRQAVAEIGFMIAQYYDLPLALDAINLSLSVSDNNWVLSRRAFNLLLPKALSAPPHLAEPALDRALRLYPNNITAITHKAKLLAQGQGVKKALDWLVAREESFLDNINQEYIHTKRQLIAQLTNAEPNTDISQYTTGLPKEMVVAMAIQGLNQAQRLGDSGFQFYQLAKAEPEVAYTYGRNLFQLRQWKEAREIFQHLEKLDSEWVDFAGVYAALDSRTRTERGDFPIPGFRADMARISPDGSRLAWRRWIEQPPLDEQITSSLVVTSLRDGKQRSLGDVLQFKWSPDSQFLAYATISSTGLGDLHIYSPANDEKFTFPGDYDIIDFNWVANNLMVQAEHRDQIHLIHLTPTDWEIEEELEWELNSGVNQDYAWITISGRDMLIHQPEQKAKKFTLPTELISFTDWSPAGNFAVVEEANKS